MPSFASNAHLWFTRDFQKRNLQTSGDQEQAIQSFFEVIEKGLLGELAPSFYLLSLDPGMGKTSAILSFLKAWRSAHFVPASSVLIGLSTLKELKEFVDKSGLQRDEFGVLTSDPEMNVLGLPPQRHGEARVLFTSQAMIRSRTKGKSFAESSEFHFDGRPRALRLWDEEILPSRWRTIRLDDIRGLASPLRSRLPEYVDLLGDFANALEKVKVGTVVSVPDCAALPPSALASAIQSIPTRSLKGALEALQEMAGQRMRVEADDYNGKQLLGLTEALPADLAPLVVVDASGRIRDAYSVWENTRGDLVRLPSAGNLYLKVNLHHWHRASGKDELSEPASLSEIASGIARAFQRDPEGEWLIIAPKDSLEDLQVAVDAQDHPLGEGQLHWLNWGRHRSTNDYKDLENVVLVGLNHYRQTDYQALALAASGLPIDATEYPDPTILRRGELKQNLLQAACRGSLRKANRGMAARANVFVIARMREAEQFFDQVFPGCSYVRWNQTAGVVETRVEEAIRWVRQALVGNPEREIRKQDLRVALTIRPQDLTRVLQAEAFVAFIEREGLEMTTRSIRRGSNSLALMMLED